MDIQSDLRTVPKICCITIFSLIYARFISSHLRPGLPRLLSLLPIISLLPFLPFLFTTIHFRTNSGFYLTWLCPFKLLMLSFGRGPLDPSLSLISFISLGSLPVKLLAKTNSKDQKSSPNFKSPNFLLSTTVKVALFACLLSLYRFRNQFHLYVLFLIQSFHIYLSLEVMLSIAAILVSLLLGMELEPLFNKPYFATSLRDFWGRRWNLMVSAILRPSVYDPLKPYFGHGGAVMAAFAVSGIMHEILFYYMTLLPATGEAMLFFFINGVCTTIEGWWASHEMWYRPPRIVGTVGTLTFVAGTSFWLFFPAMLKEGVLEKGFLEIEVMKGFLIGA
ncbi:hypothetical protein LUZ60_016137 [Juncus effusus]|nr:hypothetical protein LUZ60_016137 [Juncus effusus]